MLSTNASNYGIGALLQHRDESAVLRPIAAVPRVLTTAEKNYSPTDREALAIIFGMEKFYQYLFARHFTIQTDHKLLHYIFVETAGLLKMAAARLILWSIILSGFRYSVEYKPSRFNTVPDCLSRLLLPTSTSAAVPPEDDNGVQKIYCLLLQNCVLTLCIIANRTCEDPVLKQVFQYICTEWPEKHKLPTTLVTFLSKYDAIYLQKNILMWHNCIIVSSSLREAVLNKLQEGHAGIVAAKSLARFTVWWPNIDDKDIEQRKNPVLLLIPSTKHA